MAVVAEKNKESAYLLDADDDGKPRAYWQAEACPTGECPSSCKSWKGACCWSYVGAESVLSYVKQHLMHSSKHNMTEEEADAILYSTIIEEFEESASERAKYRKQLENQAKEDDKPQSKPRPKPPAHPPPQSDKSWEDWDDKSWEDWGKGDSWRDRSCGSSGRSAPYERSSWSQGKGSGKGKGKGSGKGKDKDTSYDKAQDAVKKAAAEISEAVQGALKSAQSQQTQKSDQGQPLQIALARDVGDPLVPVSLKDMQMLHASLGRAWFAASSGHQLMTQLAAQFENDSKVIGGAKSIVEKILAAKTGL